MIILSSLIFWMIVFWSLSAYLSENSKKYQENIYANLQDTLYPDEEILMLVVRNKGGFYKILSNFVLSTQLTFLLPNILTGNFSHIPYDLKFTFIFLCLLSIYLLFDFFDTFYKLLIVTNKRLIYKSLFKLGKLINITFDEMKEVMASTNRGVEFLTITKIKGLPLKIIDVSNSYQIRDAIQKIIYDPEQFNEQKKKEDVRRAKNLKQAVIAIPILFFIYLLILFYPQIYDYFTFMINKKPNFNGYMIDLQRKIRHNWHPNKDFIYEKPIKLLFKVDSNGNLLSINVLQSSGDKYNDEEAVSAVRESFPFKHLPYGAKDKEVDINFTFNY